MKSIFNGNKEKFCILSVSNWFSVILVDPNFFCLPVCLSDRSLHRKVSNCGEEMLFSNNGKIRMIQGMRFICYMVEGISEGIQEKEK